MRPISCAIVNQGSRAWAFEEHAQRLAAALWLEVTPEPADYIYLLGWDRPQPPVSQMFIPYDSILIASDKRRHAELFSRHGVRTPRTHLLDSWSEVMRLIEGQRSCV